MSGKDGGMREWAKFLATQATDDARADCPAPQCRADGDLCWVHQAYWDGAEAGALRALGVK